MKQYTVDFRGVKTYQEFFKRIISGMEFPEWCGDSPDAVWDLLTGHAEHPAKITICGIRQLPKELEKEAKLNLKVFLRATEWFAKLNIKFDVKIADE